MLGVLSFAFLAVLLEAWLLIQLGQVIGTWSTVGWLAAMGLLGTWLGMRGGRGVFRQVTAELQAGRSPADSVVEGALVIAGSVLLVTPGVLSDVAGLLLFIPSIRRFLAPRVKRRALAWLAGRPGGLRLTPGPMSAGPGFQPEQPAQPPPRRKGFDHPVV